MESASEKSPFCSFSWQLQRYNFACSKSFEHHHFSNPSHFILSRCALLIYEGGLMARTLFEVLFCSPSRAKYILPLLLHFNVPHGTTLLYCIDAMYAIEAANFLQFSKFFFNFMLFVKYKGICFTNRFQFIELKNKVKLFVISQFYCPSFFYFHGVYKE